jgi:GT2 family glycosyltransferase
LPSRAQSADLDQRLHDLEYALSLHRDLVLSAQRTILSIHASPAWSLFCRLNQIRNRLLPPHSLRRRLLRGMFTPLARLARFAQSADVRPRFPSISRGYAAWIRKHEPTRLELQGQRQSTFACQPHISILAPVHQARPRQLRAMLQSVLDQTYPRWQLCLVVGSDSDWRVHELLAQFHGRDPRLRMLRVAPDPRSAAALNAVLETTDGEFITLLSPADSLAPFAFFEVVRELNQNPQADFLYSDEDCLSRGRRKRPLFKPNWSPDTLESHNYIGGMLVLRRALVEQAGGFRAGFEEDTHYDLVLRASARAGRIAHLPQVLYHRRKRPAGSPSTETMPGRALADHFRRQGNRAEVKSTLHPEVFEVKRSLSRRPLVSILIPNKDNAGVLARCVASVRRSTYEAYELIIVDNNSREADTFAAYDRLTQAANVCLLTWPGPFNYAAINNRAAEAAAGEILLFLNNDVEVITPDWMERLLEHALRPEIGAVGAMLYYPDDTVQHAGIVLGGPLGCGHLLRHWPRGSAGYANRLAAVQNVSAVTGACLMTRKAVFEEVRGFDELFAVGFNDLDLCLKMRRCGYRVVWTPHAELYHYECTTRGRDITPEKLARARYEQALFETKWADVLQVGDACYNTNLTLDREDCTLRG